MTLSRSSVLSKDTWNVGALYPNFEAWQNDLNAVLENKTSPYWPSIAAYKGKLGQSAATFKEALERILTTGRLLEKIYTYAHLRHDEEITLDEAKTAYQKISSLLCDYEEETSWFQPELLSLPIERINEYLASPLLKPYRFYIEKAIHMRPHTLPAQEESLLAMASKPLQASSRAFSALNNADLKFEKIKDGKGEEKELTHGLFQLYLRQPDRILRENAFNGMHGKFHAFENTISELIYGQIQGHVFQAKARKFTSCLEAALYPKNIPTSVYESLLKATRRNLPSLHRYVALRKKLLGVKELHLYDMYVPLVPKVEISMNYEEAEHVVIESAHHLGDEYQNALRKGLQQDLWVDRYENKNKRSGAYSSGCYDSFPYILMNFRGLLRDTFTLAHEAGHSMHSYLSRENQPYHESHYPIFVAEVASTFNEELLMDYMLKKTTNKEERLFLLNEKIEDIRATFFRQVMFAEFELKLHQLVEDGIPLTPTLLKEIYLQLNQDFFGPDIVIDPMIASEWSRIPHFYYNFYVYQYATGISAALLLAERVLHQDEKTKENYLRFLKSGGSLYPIDLLKIAGVDMTTEAPVEALFRKFDSLVSELEKLI